MSLLVDEVGLGLEPAHLEEIARGLAVAIAVSPPVPGDGPRRWWRLLATERYDAENGSFPASKDVLVAKHLVVAADVADWSFTIDATTHGPAYHAAPACH